MPRANSRTLGQACENVYGHMKRLDWIANRLRPDMATLELGCGTGSMLMIPLLQRGFDVGGLDLDRASIDRARELLRLHGYDMDRAVAQDLCEASIMVDAVIASEVLEHVPDQHLPRLLACVRDSLRSGGTLLVTVPNGWGCFEIEDFVWRRLRIGRLLARARLESAVWRLRDRFGRSGTDWEPSTLSGSPHVQRFTRRRLRRLLVDAGFEVLELEGTTLLAGPLSNLFLGWSPLFMRTNNWLGSLLPAIASGWLCACRLGVGGDLKPPMSHGGAEPK